MLEDGHVLFDVRLSRYSITEAHGRCLLQLWSEERNVVRTAIAATRPLAWFMRFLLKRLWNAADSASLA